MNLRSLQQNFAHALLDPENRFEVELHCGIVSDQFRAQDRLQIYKNNVLFSLVEVLSVTYPITKQLIGDEAFEQLAKRNVRDFPPTSAVLSEYGEHFVSTVSTVASVTESVPYLTDIIDYEWKLDQLRRSRKSQANAALVPVEHFRELSPLKQAQARFELSNNVLLFASPWAVFDIVDAVNNEQFDNVDIAVSQKGILHRGSDGVQGLALESDTYSLLEQVSQSVSVTEINPQYLHHLPTAIANRWITHIQIAPQTH